MNVTGLAIFVGTGDFYGSVNSQNQAKTLIITDCGGLYPSSLIVDNNTAYIGMRQFVARYKLTPKNQQIDWLIPAQRWLNTNPDPFQ